MRQTTTLSESAMAVERRVIVNMSIPSAGHRSSVIEHRPSNIAHRTSTIEHRTPNIVSAEPELH
jgi:hypothetical protein